MNDKMTPEEALKIIEDGFAHPMAKMFAKQAEPFATAVRVIVIAYKECKDE